MDIILMIVYATLVLGFLVFITAGGTIWPRARSACA